MGAPGMSLSAMNTWVLAVVVLGFLACAVLLIVGTIFKSKGLLVVGGIPMGLAAVGFFGFIAWGAHAQRQSRNPSAVFEKEFGFPPPAEVKEHEGYATNIVVLYENVPPGCVYLRFNAPPEIVERAQAGWMVPTQESEIRRIHLYHLPAWWDPPRIAPAVIYATNGPEKRWPGGYAVSALYYDPTSQRAYYARECVN